MARPRTFKSLIASLGDAQLRAFWQLRVLYAKADHSGAKDERAMIRIEIKHRVRHLRAMKSGL